ncbi:17670_t:CDS:2 [Entrophospora sp. SA101]|nr:17670_t:CDS:2 [Entrophospora sp. SA101]
MGDVVKKRIKVLEKKEEALLKWILKTNQPLSIVTNEAYIEKMKVFDPEFSIPGGSYVTLSKMVPTIKELIFNLGDFYDASLLGETTTNCIDDEHEKQQLIQQLYIEYNELKPELNINQNEHQLVDFINDISLTRSYQGYKHYRLLKGKRKSVLSNDHYLLDEVKSYLDLSLASENESPLEWWKACTQAFPYLSKLALKYQQVLCQRNMKFMNVFAPSWDSNEDIESE